uniref:Uncharacterized protein n=1 Tax=Cyprinus carpio carpio TaxID=630221 RepID=A0A9J7Z0F6_CYPCA
MVHTLNELPQLKYSGFGQPWPRHGLNLLYWFAHDYIDFRNGQIVSIFSPQDGDFGFHEYHNRIEDDDDHIVPRQNLPYYEVGNLSSTDSLPHYVTKNYTGQSDNSNIDRIMVSFNSSWNIFEKIYVTQHSDEVHFDQNHTYCISTDLLKEIKQLSRDKFLKGRTNRSEQLSISMPPSVQRRQTNTCQSWKCRCALIGCGVLILLAAGVTLYCLLKPK